MVHSTGCTQRYFADNYDTKTEKNSEFLKIKGSKCSNSKSNLNRDDGNAVITNSRVSMLRAINNQESALRN